MTLLFYYLLSNILFSTGCILYKQLRQREELEEDLEAFYEDSPLGKAGTTVYMILCLTLFSIPYFIYNLVKGDK